MKREKTRTLSVLDIHILSLKDKLLIFVPQSHMLRSSTEDHMLFISLLRISSEVIQRFTVQTPYSPPRDISKYGINRGTHFSYENIHIL
jgi:hypothetical protein